MKPSSSPRSVSPSVSPIGSLAFKPLFAPMGKEAYSFMAPGYNTGADANATKLAGIIHGKWNFYIQQQGQPQTQAQLDSIRGMIAADLVKEKVSFTQAQLNAATGSLLTGGLSPAIKIKNAAKAIADAIPWYLHPKNILLLGAGGVVLYFTWPLVIKMGIGTVKRGVRSFGPSIRSKS